MAHCLSAQRQTWRGDGVDSPRLICDALQDGGWLRWMALLFQREVSLPEAGTGSDTVRSLNALSDFGVESREK